MEKKKVNGENGATHHLCIDLTPDQALKFALYLKDRVKQANDKGETIRTYVSQSDYNEQPGFTIWGSLWNRDGRYGGSLSPAAIEQEEAL